MVKAKVVSDRPAKAKCKEWLEKAGFTDIVAARKQSCDLIARKSDKIYYIEIKYSSKDKGRFFGTVMLTEMFKAICNKDNYLFLVCRGKGENINEWCFQLFSAEEFIKFCTLTTPIFHYHSDVEGQFNLTPPRLTEKSTPASEELVKQMWRDFQTWKSKYSVAEKGD